MTKEIICVLGMHRSGTSLLCEILSTMGVSFGSSTDLIAGNSANPDGYFELKELAELMMDIYADAKKMTMDPCWLDLNSISDTKKDWYCERIYHCLYPILQQCPNDQLFAIKHPRICILLPWLQECFNRMNVHVKYISIIRNPLETAQSLWKRDCYPVNFGLHLWEKHNAAILAYTDLSNTLFLNHQMLFKDFESTYRKIADFLHLRKDVYSQAKALINPGYRHHESDLSSYEGMEDLSFLKNFYETLLHFCSTADQAYIKEATAEKLEQYFKENEKFQKANEEYLKFCRRRLHDANRSLLKHKIYYNFLTRWLEAKAIGNSLEKCLLKQKIHSVAIYGMGKIGALIFNELEKSSIKIECLVDQNPSSSSSFPDCIIRALPEETEKYAKADIILVTSIASYQEIETSLREKNITNVLNLNSIW